MIQKYIEKAMENANYELLKEDKEYYGEIPGVKGVWATGTTLEACRKELMEVFEEWVLTGVAMGHELPEFEGISLKVQVLQ